MPPPKKLTKNRNIPPEMDAVLVTSVQLKVRWLVDFMHAAGARRQCIKTVELQWRGRRVLQTNGVNTPATSAFTKQGSAVQEISVTSMKVMMRIFIRLTQIFMRLTQPVDTNARLVKKPCTSGVVMSLVRTPRSQNRLWVYAFLARRTQSYTKRTGWTQIQQLYEWQLLVQHNLYQPLN
jgi:hypothetical protein